VQHLLFVVGALALCLVVFYFLFLHVGKCCSSDGVRTLLFCVYVCMYVTGPGSLPFWAPVRCRLSLPENSYYSKAVADAGVYVYTYACAVSRLFAHRHCSRFHHLLTLFLRLPLV
jgi:hypothetical protein